jgi:hypothetical protein
MLNIIFLLFLSLTTAMTIQKCHNCRHFISSSFKGDYPIGNYYGKCVKFTRLDPITSEFDYIPTSQAREDDELCGKTANKFEPCKTNKKTIVQDCSS